MKFGEIIYLCIDIGKPLDELAEKSTKVSPKFWKATLTVYEMNGLLEEV